jgi:H+/Cl- antiporter ClcA
MTSGVTRTVSGVLIVFEVTGQMYLLVPGMTTMLVAHVVCNHSHFQIVLFCFWFML